MGYYSAKLMALIASLSYPIWSDNNVAGSKYMTALENDFTRTFSQTTATFGSVGTGQFKWTGGVLAPNGKIYGIPRTAATVLEIDPVNRTTTEFGSVGTGSEKWMGGVLAPNGKIYGIPLNSTTVLEIGESQIIDNDAVLSRYLNKF